MTTIDLLEWLERQNMTMTTPAPDWAQAAGISARQLNYWTQRGWLHPEGAGGSGNPRHWPELERYRARWMARLIGAGIAPALAGELAQDLPGGIVELAPGVTLLIELEDMLP